MHAKRRGDRACGISGKDGKLLTVKKTRPEGKDIGYVGEIINVDTRIIMDLLNDDFLPIIYPIGMYVHRQSFNINGDHAAAEISQALKADKLAYLTDTYGVLTDPDDPDPFISELRVDETEKLIRNGTITGGMIPKVRNCCHSVMNGVNRVHILPDIVSFAKGIGAGLPIGGIICGPKTCDVLVPGGHGSTFGMNPVACAGACVVLDTMDESFFEILNTKAAYIRGELMNMKKVTGLDGLGLMIGIDLDGMTGAEAVSKLMEEGVMALPAGNRLRLLPPLTISTEEINKALAAMHKVLDQ